MILEEQIKIILENFFTEMNKWEVEAHARLQVNPKDPNHIKETYEIARIGLQDIYDRFLTKKDKKNTRYNFLQSPPEYDYLLESITSIIIKSKKKIEVETYKNNHAPLKNQYVLLLDDEEWKIDNKKTFWTFKGRFESVPI
jgi:hypothetical protein